MKKTILIIASNPSGTSSLRLDKELRVINDTLQKSALKDTLNAQSVWATRTIDLQRALLQHQPWIVHFCGHGEGEAGLVLEDETGRAKHVTSDALSAVFSQLERDVECVLLNACSSKVQADDIVRHINYVIGMSQAIEDEVAIAFTRGFYTALGNGESISRAYGFGKSQIALEYVSTPATTADTRKASVVGHVPTNPSPQTAQAAKHLTPLLFQKESLTEFDHSWTKQVEVTASAEIPVPAQQQSNSVSDITFGAGNNAFNFSPVQNQSGHVEISPSFQQTSVTGPSAAERQQVMGVIAQLQQAIDSDVAINPLLKSGAIAQIEQMTAELKKPEPDKSLVSKIINGLKQGLTEVVALAAPMTQLAALLSKVWGISLL